MRTSFGFPLHVAVHSDVGRVRTNNEDASGFAWLPDGSLFVIVADGMGGHAAGEIASGLAVQVLEEVVGRETDRDPRERLFQGLLEANEAIVQEGKASGTRGMGTTAVATICRGSEVHVGLVGDSRLYHIRRGKLVWRTLDHTRVQMLVDHGQLREEDVKDHPESGMLTRALGHSRMADGRPLMPDVLAEPLRLSHEDTLVLCSDGLHDLLEDWEIGRVVAGKDPRDAVEELVAMANERGAHDNVTVAVIVAGDHASPFDADYVPEQSTPVPSLRAEVEMERTVDAAVSRIDVPEVEGEQEADPADLPTDPGGPGLAAETTAPSVGSVGDEPVARPRRMVVGVVAMLVAGGVALATALLIGGALLLWWM
jgi:protein phosphatase